MSDEHNDAIKKNLFEAIDESVKPTPSNKAQSSSELDNLERLREDLQNTMTVEGTIASLRAYLANAENRAHAKKLFSQIIVNFPSDKHADSNDDQAIIENQNFERIAERLQYYPRHLEANLTIAPNIVKREIFSFLSQHEFGRAAGVSKSLSEAHRSSEQWQELLLDDFGLDVALKAGDGKQAILGKAGFVSADAAKQIYLKLDALRSQRLIFTEYRYPRDVSALIDSPPPAVLYLHNSQFDLSKIEFPEYQWVQLLCYAALLGNINAVKHFIKLLDEKKIPYYAALLGNINAVKNFIKLLDEKKIPYTNSPLPMAIISGNAELINYLMNEKDMFLDLAAAITSCVAGNVELARASRKRETFGSLLRVACRFGQLEVAQSMFEDLKNSEPGFLQMSDDARTDLLDDAIRCKNLALVRYLVEEQHIRLSVNSQTWAIESGNMDIINYVTKLGSLSPNTDLKVALKTYKTIKSLQDLIKKFPELEEKLANDPTLFLAMLSTGNLEVIRFVFDNYVKDIAKIQHHPKLEGFLNNMFHATNTRVVDYVLKDLKIHISASTISLALRRLAVCKRNLKFVKYLIEKLNAVPTDDDLFNAVITNNLPLVKYLVGEKNLVPTDQHLFMALEDNNFVMADYLNRAGVPMDFSTMDAFFHDGGDLPAVMYLVTEKKIIPTKQMLDDYEQQWGHIPAGIRSYLDGVIAANTPQPPRPS